MQVHHLNTGTMCPRGGRLITGRGGFGRARLVCHVLLVETHDGFALIDGGIGTGDIADPARLGPRWVRRIAPALDRAETALARVEALGIAPRDVRHLVLTHLDRDHAGAVPDFPWATVHVHARELAAARGDVAARYVPAQLPSAQQVAPFDDGGEAWFGFAGVRALDPRDPGILLVPLRGHTAGHTGVAVQTARGWLLHAGDSYFFHGQLAARPHAPIALRLFQRRADTDRAARIANQDRLRALALAHAGEVSVFCAHDAVEYAQLTGEAA